MGFFRQEYWSGLPFAPPGDLLGPGIEPNLRLLLLLHWQMSSLLLAPPGQHLMSTNLGNTVDTERRKREKRVREKRCSRCDFFQNGFTVFPFLYVLRCLSHWKMESVFYLGWGGPSDCDERNAMRLLRLSPIKRYSLYLPLLGHSAVGLWGPQKMSEAATLWASTMKMLHED